MRLLKDLSKTGAIRAYIDSVNGFLRNPKVIIPFLIELMLPQLMSALFIYAFIGQGAFNFFYSQSYYISTDQTLIPRVFFVTITSLIASIFIIGYFDIAGILMCDSALDKKRLGFFRAMRESKKLYMKHITVLLVLMLAGIILVFPLLGFLTINLGYAYYFAYAITSMVIFFVLTLYTRVVSVLIRGSSTEALFDSFGLIFRYPKKVLSNLLIIVIIYSACSWIFALNQLTYQILSAFVLFPWFNMFLVASFRVKHK